MELFPKCVRRARVFCCPVRWGVKCESCNEVCSTIVGAENVIFIPKPGKRKNSFAKKYRLVSLNSFLIKTLEKIINRYLTLKNNPLYRTSILLRKGCPRIRRSDVR